MHNTRTRRVGLWIWVMVLATFAGPALGDGKVFAVVNQTASIPDQQATIAYKDGVETLVIETRFTGTGKDFAWVVPLPAKPEVSASTNGVFGTLRRNLGPGVAKFDFFYLAGAALVTLFVILALAVPGQRKLVKVLVALAASVVATGVFLPALGKPRGVSDPHVDVQVLERRVIGSYETAVLSSRDANELTTWLDREGFAVETAVKPVIGDYVAAGWCFAVSRLRVDAASGEAMTPHPLCFRFPVAKPVYPMRLTGVGSTSLDLELTVFADKRAVVEGMETVCCTRVGLPTDSEMYDKEFSSDVVPLRHPEVRRIAQGTSVATHLRGTLGAEEMKKDMAIGLEDYKACWQKFHSEEGALGLAEAVGLITLSGLLMITLSFRRKLGLFRRVGISLAGGLAAVGMAWASTPTAVIKNDRASHIRWRHTEDLLIETSWRLDNHEPHDAQEVRDLVHQLIKKNRDNHDYVDEEEPREEDSHGNYTVSEDDKWVYFRTYDSTGGDPLPWRYEKASPAGTSPVKESHQ